MTRSNQTGHIRIRPLITVPTPSGNILDTTGPSYTCVAEAKRGQDKVNYKISVGFCHILWVDDYLSQYRAHLSVN